MHISGRRLLLWGSRNRELIAALAGVLILGLAFAALSDILKEIRAGDVHKAVSAISLQGWLLALVFTGISFGCLTLYDYCALKVIGSQIPYRVAARAAATSYAISNMLGLSLLTGGSVRLRIYTRAGLAEADVARVVALAAATFWSGIFILFGLSLLLEPAGIKMGNFVLPGIIRWGTPIAAIVALISFLLWSARAKRTLRAFGGELALPRPPLAIAQLVVAAVDLAASAAVVFVLVPGEAINIYPQLLAAYVLALGVAVLTHSPGGLGVFEAMLFLLLPQIGKSDLAAALIGYRLIYYLIPFAIALLTLAISEGEALHRRTGPIMRAGQTVAVSLAPLAMAGLVFGAGALLILTGALPALPDRVALVLNILPPLLLDLSHFAASIFGTILMFVAYGLYRRLDIAWLSATFLLGMGSLSALLRGFDFVEAGTLAVVFAALVWTRPAFYRNSSLLAERPGPEWFLAIASVIAASIFIGFFAYKHVEYRNDLWWQVHPLGDTQRFLRASLGVAVLAILLAFYQLLRPRREAQQTTLPLAVWQAAIAETKVTEAHLARTGDKSFLVAQTDDAFLMYRVRGRSFIVMGDPVGPQSRWAELVWRLREMADRQGGRIVFYECGPEFLPFAVDLGLGIMKLGEEAIVPLPDFTLEGKAGAKLRHAINRMEREDVTFRIVDGEELAALMPEMEQVSDEWLIDKGQREKQFSLGRFESDYILGAPVALVERRGHILAFANLWPLPGHQELSFDLMRYRADAPPGTMDFLFSQLILWGQDQGYEKLSLGVAPLSGIDGRRLAPLWARIAGIMFRHGERLYGYAGLRQYKEKFRPEWRGRYFAAPRGLSMALALIDVILLVSAPSVRRAVRPAFAKDPVFPFIATGSSCAAGERPAEL